MIKKLQSVKKQEAIAYKEEYDRKLKEVDKEAQELLSAARKKSDAERSEDRCGSKRRGSPYYRTCQCSESS